MSVDPGNLESGSDPRDALVDPDEETTLEDNAALDPVDEDDFTADPSASVYDTSWAPPDRAPKGHDFGNTLTEEREGESLDMKLSEEEPDLLDGELGDPVDQVLGRREGDDDPNWEESDDARTATAADLDDPEVEQLVDEAGGDTDVPAADYAEQDPRAGRLVEPDEGLESDTEKDMIAHDAGISGAGASAEEAAVHVVDDVGGATP
jgi:hypothetical protein